MGRLMNKLKVGDLRKFEGGYLPCTDPEIERFAGNFLNLKEDGGGGEKINELFAFQTFLSKKGLSYDYRGDGVFGRRDEQLAWEAWKARSEIEQED